MLPVRYYPDQCLSVVCNPITEITEGIHRLSEELTDTMYAEGGVGIAANQCGINARMFAFDYDQSGKPMVVINPVMVEDWDEQYEDAEGCLSLPGRGCNVVRANVVELRGLNIFGNSVVMQANGLAARVIQHEMDHLNGLLIIDRLPDDQRKKARRQWWGTL